jgi:UDP-glucose 4-epimerase
MKARGYTVHGVGHGGWTAEERSAFGVARWYEADITLEALRMVSDDTAPDVVMHCGGSGTVAHSYQEPASDFNRTVETTLAALEFTRQQAMPPCFVLISSAAVYGDQGDVDIDEGACLNPVSPYGYHKVMAEKLCESYHRFFNVRTRVVRLFSVYGDGLQKQLLWDAMNKFRRGESSFFGTGDEMRDWIHVEDAARLLGLAAAAPATLHTVYNGGYVKARTREVLGALARAALAQSVPTFSGQAHPGNPRRLTGSTERARIELGFEGRIGLEDGLCRYANWFASTEKRPS